MRVGEGFACVRVGGGAAAHVRLAAQAARAAGVSRDPAANVTLDDQVTPSSCEMREAIRLADESSPSRASARATRAVEVCTMAGIR